MDLEQLYAELGKAVLPKVQGDFNLESDELNEEIIQSFLNLSKGLLTADQAVAEQGIRNKVLGKTMGDMETKLSRVFLGDPMNLVPKEEVEQIFSSNDRMTEKVLRYNKAQNAAYANQVTELKNAKGKSTAGNEKLNELIETMRASLEQKETDLGAALKLVEEQKNLRHQDRVDSFIDSQIVGRKFLAPNDNLRNLSVQAIRTAAKNDADFYFSDSGEVTLLQKGTDQPFFNKESSKPQSAKDFIESIASPYLAKREAPKVLDDSLKGRISNLGKTENKDPYSEAAREAALKNIGSLNSAQTL